MPLMVGVCCIDSNFEYWIESDAEINEDIEVNIIPPQDLPLQNESTESVRSQVIL